MNRIKAVLTLSAVLLAATASAPALAWHHGGRVHFGVVIGAPFYPWYYPPYYPYYYPPVAPAAPPTYVDYCAESKTYYPYVKECPGGWQRVTPQPAPGG